MCFTIARPRPVPPEARLLLASRDTSALPLGSLRVNGRLLELGWRDLRLSRSEAESLLQAAGAPLAERDLDAVLEHTEGWPAAVYLADLAGDVPAVLGLPEPVGPGLAEWVTAASSPACPDASFSVRTHRCD